MADYPEDDQEQTFLEHLVELRGRLIKACLSILIILVFLLPLHRHFLRHLN
jgi:Sec-independent protein secretion pathway component TatC